MDTVPNGVWCRRRRCARLVAVDAEPLIDRHEVVALLFRVNDIFDELREIRKLLEGDGEEEEE